MTERCVVIIGGGLVGSLSACYFAKRGWTVKLYEKRSDIRLAEHGHLVEHRSINLAISERGLSALRRLDLGLERRIRGLAIPMRGRMLHTVHGRQTSQAYDAFGRHINSIGRSTLIRLLLDEAESHKQVSMHFSHELISADFDAGRVALKNTESGEHVTAHADLVVGADGAYSRVRQRLMGKVAMNYSQTYIEHGYCEFSMPPRNGAFAMDPSHLHIWPRGSFMLIALPNLDRSFTCTLFMPWRQFDTIKPGDDAIVAFFKAHFPDALELIGELHVRAEYEANPKGSLMYIKCSPYTYKNKAIILGDAAHAMVPFYGQGMNCGFEDVEFLDRIMLKVLGDGEQTAMLTDAQLLCALDEYSATRAPDASAIVNLALDNYVEMRSKVVGYAYIFRKHLEGLLHWLFPRHVIPLYTMVSFTSIPYATVVEKWNRQTIWLHRAISAIVAAVGIGAVITAVRLLGSRRLVSAVAPRITQLLDK
ncbi:kynurenine 3-monooxygenase, mitochondrial precursor [Coemansia spiralis]|uniref:Kynurenine 3-monooxygenase n=2 Tax=Coemansia TaxID=4863 RepID=A0A9W8KZW6_9FUNG|nr:kynurenine 3-monooxygenase, mitochondrial precursor [Coemansia umbellata]KAJ2623151.1 kynurenine 3-monooxygenase, mitochondrial precursor [Coemansia sp. RSA 1358]KAJ2680029.1 kynurenine 3-monooxygenase, mitochondrial precursor [Coemansia spiralis]